MPRGRKPDPEVTQRVRTIADMMAAGVYVTRDTPRMLASKWKCSTKTIENYATRAARLVRLNIGDDERLKTEVLAFLKRTISVCMKRGMETHPETLPDGSPHPNAGELKERNAYQWFNTGIQAIDRLASLTGIELPKRVELSSKHSLADIAILQKAMEANTWPQDNQTNEHGSSPPHLLIFDSSAGSSKSSPKEA
jgi:hypothetical protein